MAGKWETIRLGRGQLLSLDQLEQLAAKAAEGNNAALRDLGRYNEMIGRRMNQRMRELEGAGKTGDAYKRIQESIGGKTRFSQARTGSAEQLFRDAEAAQRGLLYKESTLSGIADVEQRTTETLFDRWRMGYNEERRREYGSYEKWKKSKNYTEWFKVNYDRANKFFTSDWWHENKQYATSDTINRILDKITSDGGEEILARFRDWMEEDDPFAPLEGWYDF